MYAFACTYSFFVCVYAYICVYVFMYECMCVVTVFRFISVSFL